MHKPAPKTVHQPLAVPAPARRVAALGLAVMLGLGGAASAQTPDAMPQQAPVQTPGQTPGQTPEQTTVQGATAGGDATAAPGTMYEAEVHGAWSRLCTVSGRAADPCEIYQLLVDDTGNAVAEITIVDLPPSAGSPAPTVVAGAVLITPLETYLPALIRIGVDGGPRAAFDFDFCAAIGCVARIALTAEDIAAFRRGTAAQVVIAAAAAPETPVALTMSLAGFTAGYEALQKANAAARAD
jgi:invasion protein IalB